VRTDFGAKPMVGACCATSMAVVGSGPIALIEEPVRITTIVNRMANVPARHAYAPQVCLYSLFFQ